MVLIRTRAFTLIELLVVIAVIGLLASILLVTIGGARDDAKEAAVLSQMKSAQIAATRCLFKNKALYCGSPSWDFGGGVGAGPVNCNDANTQSVWHWPAFKNTGPYYFDSTNALCGSASTVNEEDTSLGTWPDVTKYGFRYGTRAESDSVTGKFAFYAFKYIANATDPRVVICCTQKGCSSTERTATNMNFFVSGGVADYVWPLTDFCLQEAGFTFDGSNAAIGD